MAISVPTYTSGERIADAVVHVLGIGASLIAASLLIVTSVATLQPSGWVSVAVYATGMITVFAMSAGYHLTMQPKLKAVLRRFDHAAIFVKIAGTYTPFAVLKLAGVASYALLGAVWTITLFGVVLKLAWPAHLVRTSYVLYLGQGWVGVFAMGPLSEALPVDVLLLLLGGGLLYTVGVLFHVARGLRYHNAIWHSFVLAASACHFAAVMRTVTLST